MKRCSEFFKKGLASGRVQILVAGAAVVAGGFLYIIIRPAESIFFSWIRSLGLGRLLDWLRSDFFVSSASSGWFMYSLPNALWAFAYACLITVIWSDSRSYARYFWMATIPLLVFGYELLQYTGHITGTFCIQDLIAGAVGLCIGIIFGLSNKFSRRSHYENSCTI